MKKLLALVLIPIGFTSYSQTTWSEDAAEVFYNNCTSCHHPEGIGTFSLLDYASAEAYKSSISAMVSAGIMPPWTADSSFQHYYDERLLTTTERETILNWVADGALEGDPGSAPPPPVYAGTQILPGTPDMTIQIPNYMSKATALYDDYVCFSIPSGLLADKKVRAIEVVPGNQQIVHHAVVYHDEDASYVTDTVGSDCTGPVDDEVIAGYVPGAQPTVFPANSSWQSGVELKAGSNIVFAMHYPHGSYGEWDSTKVNFYFYEEPVASFRQVFNVPLLIDTDFNIPAETTLELLDTFAVEFDLTLLSVQPHMHLIGTFIESYGISNTTGDTLPHVRIPAWDFEWQDIYTFEYLQPIFTDDTIYGRCIWDNTSSNPNNPNTPPEDIGFGLNTDDEMFIISYSLMLYQAGDEDVSVDSLNTIFMSDQLNDIELDNELTVFPNPFTDNVSITYNLLKESQVNLFIYDTQGRRVRKLLMEKKKAGKQSVNWDGMNDSGTEVTKGLYYFSMLIDGKPYSGRILKK